VFLNSCKTLNSIKYSRASSCESWLSGEQTNVSTTMRELTQMSVCMTIHLPVIAGGVTRGFGARSQAPALLGPAFTFINMLVTGDQAWLSSKPPSLSKYRCYVLFTSYYFLILNLGLIKLRRRKNEQLNLVQNSFILLSVLRNFHSLVKSEFSKEYDQVLSL
jgi:hypothetical protein